MYERGYNWQKGRVNKLQFCKNSTYASRGAVSQHDILGRNLVY